MFSCEVTVVFGFRKFPVGLFKIGCHIYMPSIRNFKKLKIVLSHMIMTQWYQISFPVLNWNSCSEERGRDSSCLLFFYFLEGWQLNVVNTGWAHFFLERGQRGEIPISSDFTVERGHSIFLLNVYTFLGKFLSFSSLNNLWHFLEIRGNSSMFKSRTWKKSHRCWDKSYPVHHFETKSKREV